LAAEYPEPLAQGPLVTTDAQNSFLMIWPHDALLSTSAAVDTALSARRFSTSGRPLGDEQFLLSGEQFALLAAASDARGDIAIALNVPSVPIPFPFHNVVWRLGPNADPTNTPQPIDDGNHCFRDVDIAMAPEGDCIIACGGSVDLQDAIFARRFDQSGLADGPSFRVDTAPIAPGTRAFSPRIARSADGTYVIVWAQESYSSSSEFGLSVDIMARAYDAQGTALGDPFVVAGSASPASLAPVSGGQFIVTYWNQCVTAVARRFNASGTLLGSEFEIGHVSNCPTATGIGSNGSGTVVVVWSSGEGRVNGRVVTTDPSDPCQPTVIPTVTQSLTSTPSMTPTPVTDGHRIADPNSFFNGNCVAESMRRWHIGRWGNLRELPGRLPNPRLSIARNADAAVPDRLRTSTAQRPGGDLRAGRLPQRPR
jgi:hypothetical protein